MVERLPVLRFFFFFRVTKMEGHSEPHVPKVKYECTGKPKGCSKVKYHLKYHMKSCLSC